MTKYIVKCKYAVDCQNISDCLIEKIIGKIQNKALIGGLCETVDDVLDLFEIEEQQ